MQGFSSSSSELARARPLTFFPAGARSSYNADTAFCFFPSVAIVEHGHGDDGAREWTDAATQMARRPSVATSGRRRAGGALLDGMSSVPC